MGALLLILGLQWLKKALLRIVRPSVRRKGAARVGWSIAGAIAALAVIGGIAFLIRGWLSRIPREWLRFAVGILLAAFGTFWAGEGALVRWPGGDLALLELLGIMAATAFAYLALLGHNAAMIRPGP